MFHPGYPRDIVELSVLYPRNDKLWYKTVIRNTGKNQRLNQLFQNTQERCKNHIHGGGGDTDRSKRIRLYGPNLSIMK